MPKARDCDDHVWYRQDRSTSACYHCRVTRPRPFADGYPRALSDREAEILRFMLGVDDDRLDPLREQAASAVVTGMCTCGCATIHLAVDRVRGCQFVSRLSASSRSADKVVDGGSEGRARAHSAPLSHNAVLLEEGR